MTDQFTDSGVPPEDPPTSATNKSRKPKAPPPATLLDYYAEESARAAPFIAELRRMNITAFPQDDEEQVLQQLEMLDPSFSKTHALMQRAMSGAKSTAASVCLVWVATALLARLKVRYGWAPREEDTGLDRLLDVTTLLVNKLQDKQHGTASFNELLVALAWSIDTQGIDTVDAIRVLRQKLLGKKGAHRDASADGRYALAYIMRSPGRQKRVVDLLRYLDLWERRIFEARAETLTWREKSDDLSRRIQSATLELGECETDLKERTARLETADRMLADLNERFRQSENVHSHSVGELRGQVQGFLSGQLRSLLGAAEEALTLSPPRLTVVRERVEMALGAIDEELRWLKSSG